MKRITPKKGVGDKPPTNQSQSQTPSAPASAEYRSIKSQWAQLLAQEDKKLADRASRTARRTQGLAASEAELVKAAKEKDVRRNKLREQEFKTQHGAIMGLLGWLL